MKSIMRRQLREVELEDQNHGHVDGILLDDLGLLGSTGNSCIQSAENFRGKEQSVRHILSSDVPLSLTADPLNPFSSHIPAANNAKCLTK
jgi:hypothetical protein